VCQTEIQILAEAPLFISTLRSLFVAETMRTSTLRDTRSDGQFLLFEHAHLAHAQRHVGDLSRKTPSRPLEQSRLSRSAPVKAPWR
jgi:hypothetical protein